MLNFLDYICEQMGEWPGNYVAARTEDPVIPKNLLPKSGTVPEGKSHITLMYSMFSCVDGRILDNFIKTVPHDFQVTPTDFECFDAKGDNEGKAAVVMCVSHPFLQTMHDSLKTLGMEHSYPEFKPHITIAYDVDLDEAYEVRDRLRDWLVNGNSNPINTIEIYHEPVDKEWSKKL